jgi:hypothetical protein
VRGRVKKLEVKFLWEKRKQTKTNEERRLEGGRGGGVGILHTNAARRNLLTTPKGNLYDKVGFSNEV